MDKKTKRDLAAWLRQQAHNEEEMMRFNDQMRRNYPDFKPLIDNDAHQQQATRLMKWANAVEEIG